MDSLRPPSEILAALPAFEKHLSITSITKESGAKTAKHYSGHDAAFDASHFLHAAERASVRSFIHKMRSTFATDLYDEGHGLKEISIVMGHSSVAITGRYVSISEKVLKQTMISMRRWKIILGGIDET